MQVKPLHPTFGVEVLDADLQTGDLSSLGPTVADLLVRYSVVLFRNQDLSMHGQVAVTRSIGEIEPVWDPADRHPDNPLIHVVSNEMARLTPYRRSSQVWHTDRSFMDSPTMVTVLTAVDVPPPGAGGGTSCADMRSAYQGLDEQTRTELEELHGIHSYSHMLFDMRSSKYGQGLAESERADYPPTVHPLVKHHPIVGTPALYLNELCLEGVLELPGAQGRRLLSRLYEHSTQGRFIFTHEWLPGDVLLWDNSSIIHRGTPSDPRYLRIFHRTTTHNMRAARD